MKKKKKKLKIYRVLALILVILTVFAAGTLTYFNVLPYKYLVPGMVVLAFIIFFIVCMLCRKTRGYVKVISITLTLIIMGTTDGLYDCCRYYNRTTERASGNS